MPDNAIYYQLAYGATALVYAGYGLSLWLRARRLEERERARAARDGERPSR
jgi:hypothetical protein